MTQFMENDDGGDDEEEYPPVAEEKVTEGKVKQETPNGFYPNTDLIFLFFGYGLGNDKTAICDNRNRCFHRVNIQKIGGVRKKGSLVSGFRFLVSGSLSVRKGFHFVLSTT